VPLEEFSTGAPELVFGDPYLGTIEAIVASTVLELVAEAVADTRDVVWIDRYIAAVVEAVQIASKQEAVGAPMFAALCVRPDVGGLQDWVRMLVGNSARARWGAMV
jgi:hypothetical protein